MSTYNVTLGAGTETTVSLVTSTETAVSVGGLNTYEVEVGGNTYNVSMRTAAVESTGADSSGVFNPLAYGSIGQGNDAATLQACIDAAVAAGRGTIKIPPLDYVMESGIVLSRDTGYTSADWIVVDAYGAKFTAADDLGENVLTIGATGKQTNHVVLRGGLFAYDGLDTFTDSGSSCVKIINGTNIIGYDVEALYGFAGIALESDGVYGSAYNNFYNSSVRTCLNAIRCEATASGSWINENLFHGGRISYALGNYDASAGYALSLHAAASPSEVINRNRFKDISVECALTSDRPGFAYDEYGRWNEFNQLRTEGYAYPLLTLGNQTREVRWVGSPTDFSDPDILDIVDISDINKVVYTGGKEMSFPGGTSSAPALSVWNKGAANGSAVTVKNYDGTTDVYELYSNGSGWMKPLSGAPSSPTTGMYYFDNTHKAPRFWNGTAWKTVATT